METLSLQGRYASAPFDALASSYDDVFTHSLIGRAQRQAVRRELNQAFRPGQHILEINCGTGVDAVDLAERGLQVLSCDASACMIDVARKRAESHSKTRSLPAAVTFRVLATEDLKELQTEGWTGGFDGAFSNFAGLNCVRDLATVAQDLARLLKPGALSRFGTRKGGTSILPCKFAPAPWCASFLRVRSIFAFRKRLHFSIYL